MDAVSTAPINTKGKKMSKFENKLVAVMNKSVEPGKMLNALAHMCIGFGAHLGTDKLQLIDYIDANENVHQNISKMPFIILRSGGNKLRQLRERALEAGIDFVVFSDTMTVGSWEEQLERTRGTNESDLTYYGIVLYGPWDKVTELTKKFSLWK